MWICLKFEMEGGKVGVHHPLQSRIGVQASLDLNCVRIYAVYPNEVGGFFYYGWLCQNRNRNSAKMFEELLRDELATVWVPRLLHLSLPIRCLLQ